VPIAARAVELLTADPAEASVASGRALLLEVTSHTGQATDNRLRVTGEVRNPTGQHASAAWVTVTIYDAAEAVIGYRKVALAGGVPPGGASAFAVAVDSLAGPIERYALVAEGRP
jgi:hypothetical protein